METEKPKDPQIVFGNPLPGLSHEADSARLEIGEATERVDDTTLGSGIERVHGKIPSPGVFFQAVGKGDGRPPAKSLYVTSERCHLMGNAIGDHSHSAMFDARGNRFQPCLFGQPQDCFGPGIRRDVDICDRLAHQRIPHAPPDE
jgi:hypothetical protein